LDSQRVVCEEYCQRRGYILVDTLYDSSVTLAQIAPSTASHKLSISSVMAVPLQMNVRSDGIFPGMCTRVPTSFGYQYDFGDDWQHDVQVEKILDARPGVVYPRCIKGNRACPPEDCGGVWGYADMLRRQKQKKSKRRRRSAFSFDNDAYDFLDEEEVRFRMSFDPTAFDLDAVNAALARLQER
jgi:hypothetical protein